jgi:hypothetical protein
MGKRYMTVLMLVAALGLWAVSAFAQEGGKGAVEQLKTAIQHSGFSQNYDNIQTAKQHLQHVVNCIEGQRGPMYDGGVGNPCEGKGNGAMADSAKAGGKMAQATVWLEVANDIAVSGVKAKDISKVKAAAWTTQTVLEHADKATR